MTPESSGGREWTITITTPAEPASEVEAFFGAVAAAVHSFEPRTGWDPHMSAELGCLGD